ncbi:MAG: hypothetical protein IPF73_15315 [Betaproteobacteria bacterium]|nr:hypothetical protein [Betaproteobacteria bacterium]
MSVHIVASTENFALNVASACDRSCSSNERQYVTITRSWSWPALRVAPSEPSSDTKPEKRNTWPAMKPPLSPP